jgi:hypothetical protein
MKNNVVGILTGICLGFVIVLTGLLTLSSAIPFQASQTSHSGETFAPSPGPTLQIAAAPVVDRSTGQAPSSIASPVTPSPDPSRPVKSQLPPDSTAVQNRVVFDLSITGVSGSGFSRIVFARITNTGTADAHNASILVEAFYQGSKVKLAGKDNILISLGTLKAGENRTVQADLSFNIADSARINKNGVDFVITLKSDENQQSLKYNYIP